jgi:hypothetical protein
MRLLLEKCDNCITEIVVSRPSWPLVILDSLMASSKSRCPLLDSPKAQCILVISLFKFGDDLCVRFPAKTIVSNLRIIALREFVEVHCDDSLLKLFSIPFRKGVPGCPFPISIAREVCRFRLMNKPDRSSSFKWNR